MPSQGGRRRFPSRPVPGRTCPGGRTLLALVVPADIQEASATNRERAMGHIERHRRRSIRLKGYDYTRDGAYFVTLCTQERVCVFGTVADGEMQLNECGRGVVDSWLWLAERYPYVHLDEWAVMPNHMHGIIVIVDDRRGGRGGSRTAPTGPVGQTAAPIKRKPLGRLIGAFKPCPPDVLTTFDPPPARNCGNATTTNTSFATTCRCAACGGTSPAIPRGGSWIARTRPGFSHAPLGARSVCAKNGRSNESGLVLRGRVERKQRVTACRRPPRRHGCARISSRCGLSPPGAPGSSPPSRRRRPRRSACSGQSRRRRSGTTPARTAGRTRST